MNPSLQSPALEAKTPTTPDGMTPEVTFHGPLEVVAKAKRRTFTAEYKARVLRDAEAAEGTRGGVGKLLRTEGLYSSHLTKWRSEAEDGALKGLSKKRGRKPSRTPESRELEQLRREKARLEEKLRKAEIIIDVQKKVATLLGLPPLATPDAEEA